MKGRKKYIVSMSGTGVGFVPFLLHSQTFSILISQGLFPRSSAAGSSINENIGRLDISE